MGNKTVTPTPTTASSSPTISTAVVTRVLTQQKSWYMAVVSAQTTPDTPIKSTLAQLQQQLQDIHMTDTKSLKSDISDTTMGKIIHTMITNITVVTKVVDDLREKLKDTEEAQKDRNQKIDEAQTVRDQQVETIDKQI